MKLFVVLGTLHGGGAERVIANILPPLLDLKTNITLIPIYGDGKKAYDYDSRVSVIAFENTSKIRTIFRLRKIFKQEKPDVILSFLDTVCILVRFSLFGLRHLASKVVFAHRNDPYSFPESKIVRRIRDWSYKKADCLVFQTDKQQSYFKVKKYCHIKKTVIENPIVSNLPDYCGQESTYFIAAGRLTTQKNYPLMIDAFSRFVNDGFTFKLFIFGNGPLRDDLIRLIREKNMGNSIFVKPFTSDIHSLVSASKGFLMSSDYEGISNSMLEALAIGAPVICTDYPSGGAKQYIDKEVGFLVPCGDVQAFTDALIFLTTHHEIAVNNAAKGKRLRKALDPSLIATKWCNLLNELVIRRENG